MRGRGEDRFGYEEIGEEERKKVEGDTILMLRMWILMVLAQGGRELVGRRAWMVKEHPEDPKSYVSEEEWQRAKARGGVPLVTRTLMLVEPLKSVTRLHSDRGRELVSTALRRWAVSHGLHRTLSSPDEPQANGRAEAAVRWVKRKARSGMGRHCRRWRFATG